MDLVEKTELSFEQIATFARLDIVSVASTDCVHRTLFSWTIGQVYKAAFLFVPIKLNTLYACMHCVLCTLYSTLYSMQWWIQRIHSWQTTQS